MSNLGEFGKTRWDEPITMAARNAAINSLDRADRPQLSNLEKFDITRWDEPITIAARRAATDSLETGKVLFFPQLAFNLTDDEKKILLANEFNLKAKNISFNGSNNLLKNIQCAPAVKIILQRLLQRYATQTRHFLAHFLPHYAPGLHVGRTSFRPAEIYGRKPGSYRKDDTRLHVDAFPANPNQGRRILRVFSNINPYEPRVWHLGEPFAEVLHSFLPRFKAPLYGSANILQLMRLTRGYRTLYDHYMLQLHDAMKADLAYQKMANKQEVHFPPNSSWVVYTDLVSHAALKGRFVLEQTFYLPIQAMYDEQRSPLRMLERTLGQKLIPAGILLHAG